MTDNTREGVQAVPSRHRAPWFARDPLIAFNADEADCCTCVDVCARRPDGICRCLPEGEVQVVKGDAKIWMVYGIAFEPGHETPTYGPFKTYEEAQEFAQRSSTPKYVYDDVQNRASNCGPWLP